MYFQSPYQGPLCSAADSIAVPAQLPKPNQHSDVVHGLPRAHEQTHQQQLGLLQKTAANKHVV